LRNSPEIEASAYARELYHQLMAEELFLNAAAPLDFNPLWLTTILALDTGHMTTMDYDGRNITIAGIVNNLEMIEAFRQNLADTGIFEYVGLGRIRSHEEQFIYELLIVPYISDAI